MAGTPYPIVDDNSLNGAYAISYFPTIYAICPDKTITEMGQAPTSSLYAHHQSSCALDYQITSINHVGCFGESSGGIEIEISGETGNQTYMWSNGHTQEDLTNAPAGTYTLTVQDGVRQLVTAPININQPFNAVSIASSNVIDAPCFGEPGGAISVSATGGTGPYFYSWSNGSTGSTNGNLMAGQYNVMIRDANGCETYNSYIVNQPDPILTSVEVSPEACEQEDGQIVVNASGGSSNFTYDIGQGYTSSPIFEGLTTGFYTLTVQDANGCQSEEQVFVDGVGGPDAEAVANGMLTCNQNQVVLNIGQSTVGSNIEYHWIFDEAVFSNGASVTVDEPGLYTLTVIDGSTGCESYAEVEVVADISSPEVFISDPEMLTCDVAEVELQASVTNIGPNTEVTWFDANGNVVGQGNNATVDSEGTYYAEVVNLDNGCMAMANVVVEAYLNYPIAMFTTSLNGYTLSLQNLSGGDNAAYTWTISNGMQSTEYSPYLDIFSSGVYTICLEVDTECGTDTYCQEVIIDLSFVTTDGQNHDNTFGIESPGQSTNQPIISPNSGHVQSTTAQFFPNPASHTVQFVFSGSNSQLQISNLNGQVVFNRPLTEDFSLDVSQWTPGVYMVVSRTESGIQTSKLVIQH